MTLREKFEKWANEASIAEAIYEPKYGGKDHSGYETLMKYEVNYEREECFVNGALKAFELLAPCLEALELAADNVTWVEPAVDGENQVILTYGYHVEKCQEALARLNEKLEGK